MVAERAPRPLLFSVVSTRILARLPLLFPPLGPSAFILFYTPMSVAASPRNVIMAHFLAVGAGLGALHLLAAFIVLVSYPALQIHTTLSDASPTVTIRMRSIGTRGLSWRTLSILADFGTRSGIPNLADYLTHRAYQETLIFAGPYEFPKPGQRIRISEYRIDPHGGEIPYDWDRKDG